MKASELIVVLADLAAKHGDLEVVSGFHLTGYGAKIEKAEMFRTANFDGVDVGVIDLDLSHECYASVFWEKGPKEG